LIATSVNNHLVKVMDSHPGYQHSIPAVSCISQ